MAYSCVRVQFEIGHEASIRNKRTPDGFTHDWEVFVRGADNAEIHHFVDKVVFHLHETFPKPKRIVKEPPYVVKESGYAGFNLPVDIYMKTKEEGCRKIRFFYDLVLQPLGSGSARISNVVKEKSDFLNPAEDFRRKLIRGGGVGVGSDGSTSADKNPPHSANNVSNNVNSNNLDELKNSPHSSGGKGKGPPASAAEPPTKKHKAPKEPKPEESRLTNSFAELFGTPIKTSKHSPKSAPKSDSKNHDKSGKESTKPPKQSPAKEKDKNEKDKREKETEKSGSKEKERNKDKDSHKGESEKTKDKAKKSSLFVLKDFIKKEDDRGKKVEEKEKDKPKIESTSKSDRKHEDKKSREDKEKKDKHKKESQDKKEIKEAVEKEKVIEKKHDSTKEAKEPRESGSKHKADKEEKKSKPSEKLKEKNVEVEKTKHKHKKKDKHRKEEEREKSKKKEKEVIVPPPNVTQEAFKVSKPPQLIAAVKEKVTPPCSPPPPPPPPIAKTTSNPLNQLIAELSDKDTDSEFSGSEEIIKPEPVAQVLSPPPPSPPPPPLPPAIKIKEEKKLDVVVKEERPDKPKKKEKKSKDDEHKKRKRKHKDRDSSREEPVEKNLKVLVPEPVIKEEKISPERFSPVDPSRSPSPEETLFTEDYINQLKDLQHKIMTLQDNADLQKVVQVISETGQFEITQRTFDFDLCALDPSTVKMLQDMFVPA